MNTEFDSEETRPFLNQSTYSSKEGFRPILVILLILITVTIVVLSKKSQDYSGAHYGTTVEMTIGEPISDTVSEPAIIDEEDFTTEPDNGIENRTSNPLEGIYQNPFE